MDALTPFTELADGPCTDNGELLLSLAAEFWPVDAGAARGAARRRVAAPVRRRGDGRVPTARGGSAPCSSATCWSSPTPASTPPCCGSTASSTRAARTRCCWPCSASSCCAAPASRAAVCSSPTRWFVGLGGNGRTVLLDARLSAQADPCPDRVRRHCAHEVAFCALTGLAERFAREGRRSRARLALALRIALPVDEAVRIALQRDLDGFDAP